MRILTKKQKELLRNWYSKNKAQLKSCCFGKADEIPDDLWNELINIHDTEILYQEANGFLEELCFGE